MKASKGGGGHGGGGGIKEGLAGIMLQYQYTVEYGPIQMWSKPSYYT